MLFQKICKSNDRIHRRPNIMRHVEQEITFRFICRFCRNICPLKFHLLLAFLLYAVIYISHSYDKSNSSRPICYLDRVHFIIRRNSVQNPPKAYLVQSLIRDFFSEDCQTGGTSDMFLIFRRNKGFDVLIKHTSLINTKFHQIPNGLFAHSHAICPIKAHFAGYGINLEQTVVFLTQCP